MVCITSYDSGISNHRAYTGLVRCADCKKEWVCTYNCLLTGELVVVYIHECPFCHVVVEADSEFNQWCDDHQDKYTQWMARYNKPDNTWACPGCDHCNREA